MATHELIIVGGGLSGSLLALWLSTYRPQTNFLLLERGETLGGNHTWSFHATDISERALQLLGPMLQGDWPAHEVLFPKRQRVIQGRYLSMSSSRVHKAVIARLPTQLQFRCDVSSLTANTVSLSDGTTLAADCVIDARGWPQLVGPCGYQKFTGLDLRLAAPHGLAHPVLMDATCRQSDGFRFFYLLPWSPTQLLVEDTRYSDDKTLDAAGDQHEILSYVARRGWKLAEIEREEHGVLPIPLVAPQIEDHGVPSLGTRGGFFHDTTGYSVPMAVQCVEALAALPTFSVEAVQHTLRQLRKFLAERRRFFLLLNRLLFRAGKPAERYRILQRFYGFSEELIARFYRADLTVRDRMRILAGKPPVPIWDAVRCLSARWLPEPQKG